jgi:hypothetical protein
MSRKAIAIALGIALLAVTVACTPRNAAQSDCLGGSRPIFRVPSPHVVPWPGGNSIVLPNNTAVDARGRSFDDSVLDADGFGTGVKFHLHPGYRNNLCFAGGSIYTGLDPEDTSFDTWHRIVGMTVLTPNFTVVGTSFFNEGDMIAFGATATNWKVIGVKTDGGDVFGSGYIHDDCIENDGMNSGLVDDVKLDGCSDFLSSFGGPDGHTNTVEVRNSLIRVAPYRNSYNTPKYGTNRHGGFFKWAGETPSDGVPPHLYVHDSTFRADDRAYYGGNANGFLALPPGSTCHDVTLINTASWQQRDIDSWTSQCTNVTFGTTADWNAKTADWDAAHGTM